MTGPDERLVVLCTAPDDAVAAELARGLVEASLVACVNVVPGLRSYYRWEGAVQEDNELLLIAKTTRAAVGGLIEELERRHPYECPEIIALPVTAGLAAYLDWIGASVGAADN